MSVLPAYREIVDFIAAGTTPHDLVAFHPSEAAHRRVLLNSMSDPVKFAAEDAASATMRPKLEVTFTTSQAMAKFPMLMYHEIIVSETQVGAGLKPVLAQVDATYSVEENIFIKQIEYLRNSGHQGISLDEYVKLRSQPLAPESDKPLIEKPIIITFDDGHLSNYTHAFPVLQEYDFVATFFVTVKNINSPAGMTWGQLREMADSGMSIQSHTMSHPFLSDLEARQIRRELAESKSVLEEQLGRPVSYLALPGGRYSLTVKKIAKEVGYQAVCTSIVGNNTLTSDLCALKRWAVQRDTSFSTFRSIVQMKPATVLRYKARYFMLTGLKKVLGNENYDAMREKLLR